jgi:hypothetical protein
MKNKKRAKPGRAAAAKGQPAQAKPRRGTSVRIPRLEQIVSAWLDRLAASRSPTAQKLFAADIAVFRDQVFAKLDKHGLGPDCLPVAQQRLFARTLLWGDEPWLSIIPQAALAFETSIRQITSPGLLAGILPTAEVRYLPLEGCLWRVSHPNGRLNIGISDLFLLDVTGEITGRLAKFLLSRGTRRSGRVRQEAQFLKQWVGTEHVLRYLFALEERITISRQESCGAVYDLQAIYMENNKMYFADALRPSELCWSQHLACCRTGYYNPLDNSITISRALDAPDVPEFVVAFVLYHEMLHQESRRALLGKPGRVHDKAFRAAERKFSRYDQAESWLKRLAENGRVIPD